MSRSGFLDINSNPSQNGHITDEEQILDKFIIINVLNDFNDHQTSTNKQLGYLSEIEIKKHIDGLRGYRDFQSKDVNEKIRTVLDLIIADREKKIHRLNEILDTEAFLYNLDLPNAYGLYLNSLDKNKKELETILINRLGLVNGNLNEVLTEVQMGRLKAVLTRAKETSRTFSPYGNSPTVDETSPREVFRLVCFKFKETQLDNYKVLGTILLNEMSECLKNVPTEQLSDDEKRLLGRLNLERCTGFSKAWLENKMNKIISYEDFIFLMNNYDGYPRYSRFISILCQACYHKHPITKILEGDQCACTVCYYCAIKSIEGLMATDEELKSFDCPKCKKPMKCPDDLPSIKSYHAKLSAVATPEKSASDSFHPFN